MKLLSTLSFVFIFTPTVHAAYLSDASCNVQRNGRHCGENLAGSSSGVTSVAVDECLACYSGYKESSCGVYSEPYKAYLDGGETTDYDDCRMAGCVGPVCESDETQVSASDCPWYVGGIFGAKDEKCCKIVDTWKCCYKHECALAPNPPSPPSPPPPSPSPSSPPPSTQATNPSLGASPPPSSSSRSPLLVIIIAIVVTPSTIFSVFFFFFKPLLRRFLLSCGCVWVADCVVPGDARKAVNALDIKVSEIEKFMAKQKLPRLQDTTAEIQANEIQLHANEILGVGGYGTVFKATYKNKIVAVKTVFAETAGGKIHLSQATVANMRKEAIILSSLNHPNVLRVLGIVPGCAWMVMEYYPHGSLQDMLLNEDVILTNEELLLFALQVATGVAYLHMPDVSIVHGDLKAANALLADDGRVCLCDFGLSQAKYRSKTLTMASLDKNKKAHALTVAWSAPELFSDEPKSFASDVYALGVMLWEIFERRTPFGNMPEAAIVSQVLAGKRPVLQQTPTHVQTLMQLTWTHELTGRIDAAKIAYALSREYAKVSQIRSEEKSQVYNSDDCTPAPGAHTIGGSRSLKELLPISPEDMSQSITTWEKLRGDANTQGLTGEQMVSFSRKTGLNNSDLAVIWNISCTPGASELKMRDFALFTHFLKHRINGGELPREIDAAQRAYYLGISESTMEMSREMGAIDYQERVVETSTYHYRDASETTVAAVAAATAPSVDGDRLRIFIESIVNVKEASKMAAAHFTVTLVDGEGTPIEPSQNTLIGAETTPDGVMHPQGGVTLNSVPQEWPQGSAVILELRHYKQIEKKMSTRCWSFMHKDSIRPGLFGLPLAEKPVDTKRRKVKLYNKGNSDLKIRFIYVGVDE